MQASEGVFDARVDGSAGAITAASPQESNASTISGGRRETPGADNQRPASAQQGVEFNAEPLGEAVDQINRLYAGPQLELDRNLTNLRVTGVFQQGDSAAIARSLALAFNLELSATPSGTLRLSHQK